MLPATLQAATISVTDADGEPVPLVMVTRTVPGAGSADSSDNGYPRPGVVNTAVPEQSRFTNADGQATFDALAIDGERRFRVRGSPSRAHVTGIYLNASTASNASVSEPMTRPTGAYDGRRPPRERQHLAGIGASAMPPSVPPQMCVR